MSDKKRRKRKREPESERMLEGTSKMSKPLENTNSFLHKLWVLVNDDTLPVIRWSEDGEKILIDNPTEFTAKVLTCSDKKLFKTKNISSFVRQLNLYGFRRIKETSGRIPIIFRHPCFKRGRFDLLAEIKRRKPNSDEDDFLFPTETSQPNLVYNRILQSPFQYMPIGYGTYYGAPFNRNNAYPQPHAPYPMPPFPVNHEPTFINMAQRSAIFGNKDDKSLVLKAERKEDFDPDDRSKKDISLRKPSLPPPCYRWFFNGYPVTPAPFFGAPMPYMGGRNKHVGYSLPFVHPGSATCSMAPGHPNDRNSTSTITSPNLLETEDGDAETQYTNKAEELPPIRDWCASPTLESEMSKLPSDDSTDESYNLNIQPFSCLVYDDAENSQAE